MMDVQVIAEISEKSRRIALLENGQLAEFFTEELEDTRYAGNIYQGMVVKVQREMQVAYIDIGYEKNAFMNISKNPGIKQGQELAVQVVREASGSKGARLTTELAIPGRLIVLLPNSEDIGISKNIDDPSERERLIILSRSLLPEGFGAILRTFAQGVKEEELDREVKVLTSLYQNILKKTTKGKVPRCVYKDLDLLGRIIRDYSERIESIYIDNRSEFEEVYSFVGQEFPNLKGKLTLFTKEYNIFDFFCISIDIKRMMNKKIWLKSGGNIVIEKTEAMTVIDVNAGKHKGTNTDPHETILHINTEAAIEVARQLRLRNIGGIIIVDFINMKGVVHKEHLLSILKEEFKKDKGRPNLVGITGLGLVEITRTKIK